MCMAEDRGWSDTMANSAIVATIVRTKPPSPRLTSSLFRLQQSNPFSLHRAVLGPCHHQLCPSHCRRLLMVIISSSWQHRASPMWTCRLGLFSAVMSRLHHNFVCPLQPVIAVTSLLLWRSLFTPTKYIDRQYYYICHYCARLG